MAEKEIAIKCGLCFKNFKDQKVLPCFHTVCLACLDNLAEKIDGSGQFPCPMCRKAITIPDGGVRSFQKNFNIDADDDRNSALYCDACDGNVVACHQCRQCDQAFCGSCSKVHLRMSSSRDHDLVSILPSGSRPTGQNVGIACCKTHLSEELTIVCKDCAEVICRACKISLHKEHSCGAISEEVDAKKKHLRDLIVISENNLTDIKKDIRVVKKQTESKHTYFNEQITDLRKQKDLLISNLNKNFKLFEDKIRQLNEDQLMQFNSMNEKQNLKTENIQQTIDDAKEAIASREDIRFLKDYDSLVQKLSEIEMSLVPVVSGHNLMETVDLCTTWLISLNRQNSDPIL